MLTANKPIYHVTLKDGKDVFVPKNASFQLLDRGQEDDNTCNVIDTLCMYLEPRIIEGLELQIVNDSTIYNATIEDVINPDKIYPYLFKTFGDIDGIFSKNPVAYYLDSSSNIPYKAVMVEEDGRTHMVTDYLPDADFVYSAGGIRKNMYVITKDEYEAIVRYSNIISDKRASEHSRQDAEYNLDSIMDDILKRQII